MAHILVTGGCGFLGTWILRRLLNDGHRATVLDLEQNTKRWELVLTPERIEGVGFRRVRIDEPEEVLAAFRELAPDAVIHLAGLQVPTCRANPLLGARVNVIGTLAVFEAALALPKVPGLVYASSAAVFGTDADYDNAAVGDAMQPKPGTHYGAYKLCNELSARAYWLDKRFKSVGLRPMTVYGPGRDVGMTSFPTRAVAAAVLGQPFEIPFRGPTTYTFAEEVADFFVAAALRPLPEAPAFTVGGDVLDVPGFIAELERVLPGAGKFIRVTGGDLPVASKMDGAELCKAYPEVKRVPIREGLERTVEIFRRQKAKGRLEA